MIVLDTSAAVESLLSLPLSTAVEEQLNRVEWQIIAPQLLIVEVLQVLRRRVAAGYTSSSDADEARFLLGQLNIRLYGHELFADRIWELRDNMSAYDASYVALAEASELELLTTDRRLANAPGHNARIILID
ncbi:MAG TPA: type II toxin-antitoxin system VapC family toxin [Enteractinococcus sp.]